MMSGAPGSVPHGPQVEVALTSAKFFLVLGVVAILGSCGPRPVEPIIDRPAQVVRVYTDGKTPHYVECAEKGRRLLRQGRLGEAEAWFS